MTFEHGRFVSKISHVVPGRGQLFPRLEAGEADATLIPVHRFDAYLIEHTDSKLAPSGYYLPVGFNMGFVGLASSSQLIEQANGAIEAMLKDGVLIRSLSVHHAKRSYVRVTVGTREQNARCVAAFERVLGSRARREVHRPYVTVAATSDAE